ncbi:MAG: insulinase family protein [Alphaproteobacteria bacterium]|nr:insulinase family protein [Alphaproteobacteria bacterium]
MMKFFFALLIGVTLSTHVLARESLLNIQEITTPQGISVWMVQDKTLPIINMQFLFRDSGTALDPADKQGLVRLLSNTMDEGAGDLDSQGFQKNLTDHAITLRFNAGRDGFGGELETLTRHKDKAFHLLSLAMNTPRFDPEPVARMRDANLARIRSAMTDPEWMVARLLNDRAFSGHPYAQNSGGTLSSLPLITSDDLRGFQKNLSRDRLFVALSGDLTPEEAAKWVDHIFSALPAETSAPAIPDLTVQNQNTLTLFKQDMPQTLIQIMLPALGRDDPDFYPLQVMNYIFGGAGFGSRLMETAREQRGLTYGIYSGIDHYRHTDVMTISTSTKNENVQEMMDIIRSEMSLITSEPITDQELLDAKSYLTGSIPLMLTSSDKITGMMLSLRTEDLPSDYLDHYIKSIQSVTREDILRVSKKILNPESMTIVMVGNPVNVTPTQIVDELPHVK